ncbi:hypothetical protein BKA93DRAFT_227089 [Sparassis latifolia]|uniref:Fe2OG dioxygenase domain-containing protein n=1 Tax=Sparassis crispa TaxID=139825 RepID=A0A401GIQ7_9APHY|nr:hypothetical protein SCP_0404160 [Sparassis crispa]GBE82038.1 hypothetical protein SCP_0404160 [Sparassis crispa]
MSRRKSRIRTPSTPGSKIATNALAPLFSRISPKGQLRCRVLLEDQILLFENFLTAKECKDMVSFIESQPLELTLLKKKGEAERVNYRMSMVSVEIAQRLFELLEPHLPEFPYPVSAKRANDPDRRRVHSLNSNIRLYKYTPGQHFGPHYDDSVRDARTGAKSEWTLLVYLSGVEDGVEGGETLFYREGKKMPAEIITAPLTRGTALLHRHGCECLLHEGSRIVNGIKYILRSDLMFKD